MLSAGLVWAFWPFEPTGSVAETGTADLLVEAGEPPANDASEPVPGLRPSELVGTSTPVAIPEQLPASLSGTSVPSGWQRVDATGALIPTPQLRQLFEYYLSALGEESMPQLVARIEQALSQLQEPARSQALETLGAYLDYKLAVADLEMAYSSADPADMERRMREIHALRRTWFDADTVGAFFANEEAVDEFQVAQRRILSNDALNPEQRAAALAEAESALPESVRTARKQTRRFSEYEEVQQTLADDPQALNAWREDTFGAEAAGRLAELEQKQQDWNRRWQAYSSARDELLASSGLAGPEVEAALERLRNSHFNGAERIRAKALDSIR